MPCSRPIRKGSASDRVSNCSTLLSRVSRRQRPTQHLPYPLRNSFSTLSAIFDANRSGPLARRQKEYRARQHLSPRFCVWWIHGF